jgi:hypothetical protein
MQENTKHTPGPWEWDGDELVGACGVKVIYETDNGARGDPECCGDYQQYMRARSEDQPLIAAAPDYHEAMTECMKPDHGYNIEYVSIPRAIWQKFLAAHAKAEGRS